MSEATKSSNEPYYRREFKQQQYLFEETANSDDSAGNECFNQPLHFIVVLMVAALFVGCLLLLTVDLILLSPRDDERRSRRRQHRRPPSTNVPTNCSHFVPQHKISSDTSSEDEEPLGSIHNCSDCLVEKRHNTTPSSAYNLRN